MNAEAIERYLTSRLGKQTVLRKLYRVPMGLSRETWFVTLADRRLVLRCNLPEGLSACPTALRFEYEVYRRLADTPLPVARTLWYEEDTSILGTEFYLRELIEGTGDVPHLHDPDPQYDDLRIEVSKEHARKMALVHTVDWRSLGFGELLRAPRVPAECARFTIDRLEAQLEAFQFQSFPLVAEACDWLRANAPKDAPAIVLCKGSNGELQEVWRDGKIVGMSDWELASLGDPAMDWGSCRGFVPDLPGRWNERSLLDYYEQQSGLHIDSASVAYYRIVYGLAMIVVCHHAGLPLISRQRLDARLAYLASQPVHQFQALFAERMGLAAG